MKTVDVAAALDDSRFSGYQKLLIFGTALTVILDGVDNQLLPNALPTMVREWNLPRQAFLNALAAGPFGMMIGGVLGGILGDRIGRRTALLANVILFAAMTLAIAFVDTVVMLTALRFLAGLGFGGTMPNAAALVSEYAPRRQRPLAVTSTIVCIPVGGFLAGEVAGEFLPGYGWRMLFIAGGAVPVVIAAILAAVLPESPKYLVRRRERWSELRAMLTRISHPVSDDAEFIEAGTCGVVKARASVRELFAPELRRDTLGLSGAFFFCLLAIYVGFQLIPAMLAEPVVGFRTPYPNRALALFNFGGVAGALLGALVIQRHGSRVALLGMSGLGVMSALAMTGMRLNPEEPFAIMVMFTVTGGLLNAVQTTMYALGAHVYPTEIRGTGVGTTVAFGRIGNILAVYVGSWALTMGGPPAFFLTWAIAMAVVFASLALVRRHIPRPTKRHSSCAASPAGCSRHSRSDHESITGTSSGVRPEI
jgi:AAHS family 4-hydroxybenzoate transporter-like MFS transporter